MLVMQSDDPGVAAEDAAQDAAQAVAQARTADVLSFSARVNAGGDGLLYNSVVEGRRIKNFATRQRWMDGGTLRPIDPRWRDVRGHPNFQFGAIANALKIGIDQGGWKHVQGDTFHFRTRPLNIGVDAATRATSETDFPSRRVNANRLRLDGLWPFGIPSFYRISKTGSKEALILDASVISQIPGSASTITFRYEYEPLSGNYSMEPIGDGIFLREGNKPIILLESPWMQDSSGARQYGTLTAGAGVLEATFDAQWLLAAQAPVLVDPSTTGVSSSTWWHVEDTSGTDDNTSWWAQFDLPDIGSGSTLDSANFFHYCSQNEASTHAIITELRTSSDVTWDMSSTGSTMQGLTTFDSAVTIDWRSVPSWPGTSTWYSYDDIHGTTANAQTLAKAYDGVTNPGNWTICVWYRSASPVGEYKVQTTMHVSENEQDEQVGWSYPGQANEPYLEIWYTSGLALIPIIQHHRQQQKGSQ